MLELLAEQLLVGVKARCLFAELVLALVLLLECGLLQVRG